MAMPDPQLVVVGYQVKRVDEDNPDGKIVSRLYHAKTAAEAFAALAQKFGRDGQRFFVTEKLGLG